MVNLMNKDTQIKLATLLRAAAAKTVSEDNFWMQFNSLADPLHDPFGGVAYETATHYWGNYHSKNILLIPVKPDPYQVMQGQDALNLIADSLEQDWTIEQLKRRLKNI